jgi:ABC-2 type transport system ATP-binding protein
MRAIRKQLAGANVLRGVDLTLTDGVSVLLGPNGAGKTTLLRVLAGIATPDSGVVLCDGIPIDPTSRAWHARLGYVPQTYTFAPGLTLVAFLRYVSRLKGLPDDLAAARTTAVLTVTGLTGLAERPLDQLSGGQRRLVGLVQALLTSPQVLLLDEPTVGLDPEARQQVLSLLTMLGRERIVLVSTHIVADADPLAGRLALLAAGRIVHDGTVDSLLTAARGSVWETEIAASELAAHEGLLGEALVGQRRTGDGRVRLRLLGQRSAALAVTPAEPGIEEAYLYALAAAKRGRGDVI